MQTETQRKNKKNKVYGPDELVLVLQKVSQLPDHHKSDYRDNVFACFYRDQIWWDLLERLDKEIDLILKVDRNPPLISGFGLDAQDEDDEGWCKECDNSTVTCTCPELEK